MSAYRLKTTACSYLHREEAYLPHTNDKRSQKHILRRGEYDSEWFSPMSLNDPEKHGLAIG